MRVLLYNSAARGAGQYVRSTKIADVITSAAPDSSCRILAGNGIVDRPLPRNTDVIALPQIAKALDGAYLLKHDKEKSSESDAASLSKAFAVRRQIIEFMIDSYDPDILLVDSRPSGLAGELIEPLSRVSKSRCKSVLLLRDIVDAPDQTVPRWQDEGVYSLIQTVYDSVAFVGDRLFFDALLGYRLQPYENKVVHLGFLGNPRFETANSILAPRTLKKRVLVTVGGGFDGSDIIETVCALLVAKTTNIDDLAFSIVLGAHSSLTTAQVGGRLQGAGTDVEVLAHCSDITSRIMCADVVISMCGYNTLFELIEAQKKIIAVPRGHSGYEQSLRACLLSGIYDGLWVIPQNKLSPRSLAIALANALEAPPPQVRIPMNGAANLITHLGSLLGR